MLKQWWYERNSREQIILIGGGAITIILLAYILIWKPLSERIDNLRQANIENTALLTWMDDVTHKIQQYRQANYQKKNTDTQALLVTIEQSLLKAQLSKYIRNTQSQSDNQVTLIFQQAPFDQTINWIEQLWKQDNIVVQSATITKDKTAGQVNITLTLSR